MSKQSLRIIAGLAKGTRLKSPPGTVTRPTADRVKESLFSILGQTMLDANVLDLFAGTGALGLEAISRGALSVTFIDRMTTTIRDNVAKTKFYDKSRIITDDVFRTLRSLSQVGQKFDLVFCDPPYHHGLAEKTLNTLNDLPLLSENALIVAEHGADETIADCFGRLRLRRCINYGKTTTVSIFGADTPISISSKEVFS